MQHIVAKKPHHDQTKQEAETAVEHIQRIAWIDGRTYRRTDGRTEVILLH